MESTSKDDIITGKSLYKGEITTSTDVIKENKLTILNHICSPKKTKDLTMNSQKNKNSIYTSTPCVQQ
jgi:hypothetical protein